MLLNIFEFKHNLWIKCLTVFYYLNVVNKKQIIKCYNYFRLIIELLRDSENDKKNIFLIKSFLKKIKIKFLFYVSTEK